MIIDSVKFLILAIMSFIVVAHGVCDTVLWFVEKSDDSNSTGFEAVYGITQFAIGLYSLLQLYLSYVK